MNIRFDSSPQLIMEARIFFREKGKRRKQTLVKYKLIKF